MDLRWDGDAVRHAHGLPFFPAFLYSRENEDEKGRVAAGDILYLQEPAEVRFFFLACQ